MSMTVPVAQMQDRARHPPGRRGAQRGAAAAFVAVHHHGVARAARPAPARSSAHEALLRLVKSQQALLDAGGNLARVHGSLLDVQREMGVGDECPPEEPREPEAAGWSPSSPNRSFGRMAAPCRLKSSLIAGAVRGGESLCACGAAARPSGSPPRSSSSGSWPTSAITSLRALGLRRGRSGAPGDRRRRAGGDRLAGAAANRIWPLWAAAAQLMTFSGHIVVADRARAGCNRAYWAMTQLPPYIQLFALVCGAAFHARRFRRIGHYRSWRLS